MKKKGFTYNCAHISNIECYFVLVYNKYDLR